MKDKLLDDTLAALELAIKQRDELRKALRLIVNCNNYAMLRADGEPTTSYELRAALTEARAALAKVGGEK